MFNGLYLEFPLFLLGLILFMACEKFCKMKLPSIYFPHTGQFMQNSVSASKLLFFLKWLGITMLIVALSSPVADEPYELEPKDGYEIALILDASQSVSQLQIGMAGKYTALYESLAQGVNLLKMTESR